MSNLPPIDPREAIDVEFLINPNILDPTIAAVDVADESWSSLYQRLLFQPSTVASQDSSQIITVHHGSMNEGQNLGMPQEGAAGNKGSKLKRRKNSSGNRRKKNGTNVDSLGNNEESGEEEEGDGKVAKRKMDHNARERVRRMKLNASYLALRALLPPPADQPRRRSKKRWTAPAILDRALNYIPELQNEVEALNSQKRNLQQQNSTAKCDNNDDSSNDNKKNNHSDEYDDLHDDGDGDGEENRKGTVSVNKISTEEATIQMTFMPLPDEGLMKKFIHVMERVESELTCGVKSASTVCVPTAHESTTRIICCHLHISQINQGSPSTDSIEQVISQLQLR